MRRIAAAMRFIPGAADNRLDRVENSHSFNPFG
jgi:hypothetical protein